MSSLLVALSGLLACSEGEIAGEILLLPDVVASSKYTDYGAWADTSEVCMDDRLAVWDRYIEQVAAYLEVEPPTKRIRYAWVPAAARTADTWSCSPGAGGCARRLVDDEYQSLVIAGRSEMLHELVHAVELPALGSAHPIFIEGMAEYLSRPFLGHPASADFLEEFAAMFEGAALTYDDYQDATFFVGSLHEREGLAKYLEFRAAVPRHGDQQAFADAYARIYGGDLADRLASIAGTTIETRGPTLCDVPAKPLPWAQDHGTTEVSLRGECGDGWFFHPGAADGEPGASTVFAIEAERPANATLTLHGTGAAVGWLTGESCPPSSSIVAVTTEHTEGGVWPMHGAYRMQAWFPERVQGVAEMTLELDLW